MVGRRLAAATGVMGLVTAAGAAWAQRSDGSALLASFQYSRTNLVSHVAGGAIDVFDATLRPADGVLAGTFIDPAIGAGYTPSNTREVNPTRFTSRPAPATGRSVLSGR